MLNLSLKELKVIAKNRRIKAYKSMSKDKLLNKPNAPKPIKKNETISKIRKGHVAVNKIIKNIRKPYLKQKEEKNKTIRNMREKIQTK